MEVSSQLHAPATLPLMRLCGPQRRSERGDEEKNPQPLPGLDAPIIHPVVQRYTTELSRKCLKHACRYVKHVEFNVVTGSGLKRYSNNEVKVPAL
jgi:hypothetical protein